MVVFADAGGQMMDILKFPGFDFKLGNMRSAQDFTIYPWKPEDTHIVLQSKKRIAQIELATGKGILSDGKAGHPGFDALRRNPLSIQLTPEQLNEIKTAMNPK